MSSPRALVSSPRALVSTPQALPSSPTNLHAVLCNGAVFSSKLAPIRTFHCGGQAPPFGRYFSSTQWSCVRAWRSTHGEVSERLKELVSKTSSGLAYS